MFPASKILKFQTCTNSFTSFANLIEEKGYQLVNLVSNQESKTNCCSYDMFLDKKE